MELLFGLAIVAAVATLMGGIGIVLGRMLAPHVERMTEERDEPDDDD